MKEERIIGNNLKVLLKQKNITNEMMASSLGYNNDDITRISEGRMYLSIDEIDEIAKFLNVEPDDILNQRATEDYEAAGCIHYNHPFKDKENMEKIMDIFDWVCDIEEVL